jgi:hypothetical protein
VEGISDKNPSMTIKAQIFIVLLGASIAVVGLEDGSQLEGISQFSLLG